MPKLKDLPLDHCPPPLDNGDEWLKERLDESGAAYVSDGGGGFVLKDGSVRVSVGAPTEQDPKLESAYRQMTSILWSEHDVQVCARPSSGGVTYLYWRAGQADNAAECGFDPSDIPQSAREAISNLIAAQIRNPHEK